MEAWQNLGFTPHGAIVRLARLAEEVGFTGVTLPEHLVNPSRVDTPNPYVPAGGAGYPPTTPFLDPWVTFGALATATERLRFLANVYVLPLRDLFGAAKAISTAAVLSGDRVSVGVGIGWLREEFEAVGADFSTRVVAPTRCSRCSRNSCAASRLRSRARITHSPSCGCSRPSTDRCRSSSAARLIPRCAGGARRRVDRREPQRGGAVADPGSLGRRAKAALVETRTLSA